MDLFVITLAGVAIAVTAFYLGRFEGALEQQAAAQADEEATSYLRLSQMVRHYRELLENTIMKTYKIEIRAHFAEPEKVKMIEDACREAARTVLATAILLSEKSKPEAKFMTEDFIEGITEHDITEE